MKKSLCMVVAMFILCMLHVPSWGQSLTVPQIQQDIKAKGAQWEAGETSMTKLSPEERKMRLGLVPLDVTGKESKRLLLTASPVAIPPTMDWRNNGGNYVTSIKNQGQCGSCWAFGTTAALESAILLHRQTPNVDLDLSEQVMISCGGFGNCNGGSPVEASDYFVRTGLPPESCYPYTATYGNCAVACANWQAKSEKASDWWFAGPDASHTFITTVEAIKAALYTYGPLASTMNVYEDFYSYRGGVYRHVSGSLVGGHEISIIGYDDVNQCFIAKNSWGTGWGEAGFFRIAYSQVPTEFGGFTIGYYIAPTGCSYTATLDQGGPYYLFPGSGAKGTVTVKADSGCAWTTLSVFPWATITSGASGTGNGTVSFSLDDYPTGAARAGGLIVAGQNVFFQQQSQTPCAFAPWPAQTSVGAAGGNQSLPVTFTSGQNCPWFSVSFGTWVTATPYSGTGNGTLNYSVAPNTGPYSRTLSLQVAMYTGNSFAYTTILQAGSGGCIHSISSANPSFAASGGTGSSNVTTGSGCTWTATSNNSWITVTGGSSGSGNGMVNYSVGANTGAADRFGTITIAGQTLTVYQRAGAACTYAISPTAQSLSAMSGTGLVSVTAGSGCSWQATSNASWITVTGGSSGSGNGTVNYSVAANTGTDRSGTLTIAGQSFTVTQAAGSPTCTYAISPASNSLSAAAGTGSVSVTAGTGCAWTAASNASWITFTGGSNGSGNGTVNYSVGANSGTTSRTGTMTIASQTFTVTQAGQSCTYSISPISNSLSAAGGTGSVSVTCSASTCSWSASSNATSWLTVTGGTSGSGNGTVSYSVTANTSTTSRTGTLTIASQTFTVNQSGATCTYSISPTSNSFTATAGTGSVSVTSASGCAWTATSNATSWLTVTSGGSGLGNGSVGYSVTANGTTSSRTGTLTVGGQTFTVNQTGQSCGYVISPSSNSFTAAASTGSVSVTASSGCSWQATSNATSWLSVTSGGSGSGNGTVNYSVTANTSATSRTGTLTIGGQTFTVTQTGQSCTYSISPTSNSFTAAAGTGSMNVTAASGCAWTATSNASWILINYGPSGSGNGTVGYLVAANTNTSSRTGTITIAGQTHTVTQTGQSCSYSISPSSNSFAAAAGTGSVSVTASSGCAWTAASNISWLTVTGGSSGSGNGTVGYSVAANSGTSSRTGTMTIAGQTFNVNQTGQTCTYALNPTSQSFTSSAGTGTVNVTSASGCSWTAVSNATSWLTVTSGSSGSGNGTVSYSVLANKTTTSRTGNLTVGGQTFTVTQAGGTVCTYTLSPTSKSFTSASGAGSVSVTASSGCAWSATSNNTSWLTVTSGGNGSGNGTVNYSVIANTSTTSRTGTLTIGGQTHTVAQAGGTTCTYSISPASSSLSAAAGTGSVSVTAGSGCAWTAISNNTSWLTVTSGSNGSSNGTVGYSVAANATTASRTGTLTIAGQTHTVTQAGGSPACKAYVWPDAYSVEASGLMRYIGVAADNTCKWTVTSNASWIIAGGSGQGNGTFLLMVQGNSGLARTGTLSVNGTVVTITEKGIGK